MGGQARGDQRATDGVGDAALTDDLDRWRCGYCGVLKAIPSLARECEAQRHEPGCDGIGTDCDHIGDRRDHSLANLQWLSGPCHKAKTQREAQEARPKRQREPEPHPGRLR